MSASSGPSARCCRVCRQALPKDVTFCVGCGVQNDADDVYGKQLSLSQQSDARLARAQFWSKILKFFWIVR